jgi:hypothetical protein
VDVQAEADRLIGLDEAGRQREMLVIALRLGEQASGNWRALHQMDVEFLDGITGDRTGNGSPFEGPE